MALLSAVCRMYILALEMKSNRIVFIALIALWAGCKTPEFQVKDGNTAVELKLYHDAVSMLVKEFNAEKDLNRQQAKAFQIAEAYRQYNDWENAEKWYKQCVDLNGPPKALFQLGLMQKQQEKYSDAFKTFEQYQRVASGFEGRKQSNQCRDALSWKNEFSRIQVRNAERVNSTANDYAMEAFKSNQYVFSSSRNEATGDLRDGWTGEKFTDLFVTEKRDGNFTQPQLFPTPVNSAAHESSATFSRDGKEVFFIRCNVSKKNNEYCQLYYSAYNNDHWTEPVRLDFFADTVNVYDPYLTKDGKFLVVAAAVPENFGEADLYIIQKNDTGWTRPQNLGAAINTPQSERFPWVDEKGNLFFASNGLPGMGGLDVFKATRTKTGYKDPQNLKHPINSGADDFGYHIEKYKQANADDTILMAGYFVSNRKGGKGGDDIYVFEEKWINYFVLKGQIVEKQYENPEKPESKVLGLSPLKGAKVELRLKTDSVVATALSDSAGRYSIRLQAETDYKIVATKGGYFSNNDLITTAGKRHPDSTLITITSTIELEKIFTSKEIVIPNIYYDYDKATLRPESKEVLDSILIFFKENPDLTIEIGSHTDSRGSDSYNLKLSQARAQSVVDYLIEKGVSTEKLSAKGYGETKPVNRCINNVNCTEEEHQQNRRTTFRVASAKFTLDSIESENIELDPERKEK